MNIKGLCIDNVYIVKLKGEIDHIASAEIKDAITNDINNNRIKNLILDFSEVTFMDSSGIGMIIGRYKQMKNLNGDIIITGINAYTERVINLSGINKIIKVFSTVEEGLKYLNKENI